MAEKYEIPKEGAAIDTEYSKGKSANVPGSGVYKHPESGQTAIVQSDPLFGNAQAQAFARLGFKFEREAREDEITSLPELAAESRKAEEGNLKGLSARLDKLEGVAEENKGLQVEIAELRAEKARRDKADAAVAEKTVTDTKSTTEKKG